MKKSTIKISQLLILILLFSSEVAFASSKDKIYTFSGQTIHSISLSSAKRAIKKEPSDFASSREYIDYRKNSFDSRENPWVHISVTNPSDLMETTSSEAINNCYVIALALAFNSSTIQLHPKKLICQLNTNEFKEYAIDSRALSTSMLFSANVRSALDVLNNDKNSKYIANLPKNLKEYYKKELKNEPPVLTLPAKTKITGEFRYIRTDKDNKK